MSADSQTVKPRIWRFVNDLPCADGFSASPVSSAGQTRLVQREECQKQFIETLLHRGLIPGDEVTRLYSNLVILFRMLIFYLDVGDNLLWEAVWADWGVTRAVRPPIAEHIVEYYVDARRCGKALQEDYSSPGLLARLVDYWVEKRPKVAREQRVGKKGLRAARAAWKTLRDTRLDMLLDAAQPLCLRFCPETEVETGEAPRANETAGGCANGGKKAKNARRSERRREVRAQRALQKIQDGGTATYHGAGGAQLGSQPTQLSKAPKRKRQNPSADNSPTAKRLSLTNDDAAPPSFQASQPDEAMTGERGTVECCDCDCPYRKKVVELEMLLRGIETYLY